MSYLDDINWNSDGLVPAIAQDADTGVILMMAWMNREALELTVIENRAIYWSRSRQKLWRKGEESGHVQHLIELRLEAKNNGDYQTADNIRDELSKMNVAIKDIDGKTEWEIL